MHFRSLAMKNYSCNSRAYIQYHKLSRTHETYITKTQVLNLGGIHVYWVSSNITTFQNVRSEKKEPAQPLPSILHTVVHLLFLFYLPPSFMYPIVQLRITSQSRSIEIVQRRQIKSSRDHTLNYNHETCLSLSTFSALLVSSCDGHRHVPMECSLQLHDDHWAGTT